MLPYFGYIAPMNCKSKNQNVCYLPLDFYWPGKARYAILADAEQGIQLAIKGINWYGITRPAIKAKQIKNLGDWKQYELLSPVDEIRGAFWDYKEELKLPPPYPPLPFGGKQ